MKKLILDISIILGVVFGLLSCGYDNFSEPQSTLVGNVQYNGQNLSLRATNGSVQLQLYQDGFPLHSPITVYVDQEGKFSAILFDGAYKMVTKDGNGPWVNKRDTTVVQIKGNTQVNLEVTPYFQISNAKITVSGKNVSATFDVLKNVSTATLGKGYIVLGKTSLVDDQNAYLVRSINATDLTVGKNTISFDLTDIQLASLKSAARVTARIGIKAGEADQPIFCPLMNVNL